jgi:site-specific DNA-methyltransferase (adenine-specific)
LKLSPEEAVAYERSLLQVQSPQSLPDILDRTILGDLFAVLPHLPDGFVDLLILDPPYNLTKSFNGTRFKKTTVDAYEAWLGSWLSLMMRLLKPSASLYICGDWQSSAAIHRIAAQYCTVRNRITWEREKGRGAKQNWKNCAEDIWFCTVSDIYTFNVEAVKLKRKVMAPYRDAQRQPKDWTGEPQGNFRLTHPSNLWTDISIPFWSMPENTVHPTQKPEKLMAKLILASSNPGEVVFDPFLGSGTTSVTAKKLGRHYVGVEQDLFFCCLAEKRLERANVDSKIQGYAGGHFWERNSFSLQNRSLSSGSQELS